MAHRRRRSCVALDAVNHYITRLHAEHARVVKDLITNAATGGHDTTTERKARPTRAGTPRASRRSAPPPPHRGESSEDDDPMGDPRMPRALSSATIKSMRTKLGRGRQEEKFP